jgi:hypothetical protein
LDDLNAVFAWHLEVKQQKVNRLQDVLAVLSFCDRFVQNLLDPVYCIFAIYAKVAVTTESECLNMRLQSFDVYQLIVGSHNPCVCVGCFLCIAIALFQTNDFIRVFRCIVGVI